MSRPEDALFRVRVATFATLRAVLAVVLVLGLLVGPVLLVDSGWAMLLGMLFATIAVVAMKTAGNLPLYPAHAVGIEHRVDEDTFDGTTKHCTECGERTTRGLRRRYARQFVLLGIPLHTLEWGINDYCLDCAEPGGGPGVDPDASNDRVLPNDESASRELERALE